MKSDSGSATTPLEATALPFVISTGAQRSGEVCVLFLEMFSTQRTRISYFALLATAACVALRKGSRILPLNSTHRGVQRLPHDGFGFRFNLLQMFLAAEAFCVDLVDLFGA
jgi:hypothetical protein